MVVLDFMPPYKQNMKLDNSSHDPGDLISLLLAFHVLVKILLLKYKFVSLFYLENCLTLNSPYKQHGI